MKVNLKAINYKIFDTIARSVLKTAAIECDDKSNLIILSQTCSRDLLMYLVAIKTFTRFVKPCKVVVIGDGLSEFEKKVISNHINNLEVIDIQDVNACGFPHGGTWERLLSIIDLCPYNYVIQLDADTITLSNPIEVIKCVEENRSFTLGTQMGKEIVSFTRMSEILVELGIDSQHVQIKSELSFTEIDSDNNLKYIRGCSGFAGFSKGSSNRGKILELSQAIEQKIGMKKWREWGSEQVMSNIVVANTNNPLILPTSKYDYFEPKKNVEEYVFLHFIGTYRFYRLVYYRLVAKYIRILKNHHFS